jgi:glycosyltransferase involved in cell wall biosynthesis
MRVLPTVTIVMISYNDDRIIGDCLDSIFSQTYPREKLNVVVVDGGSNDATHSIISRTIARLIVRPDLKDQPYRRLEMAAETSTTDITVLFSADNRFMEKDCLERMMEPFVDNEIVAVETLRYGYRRNDPVLSRYFALIGGNDPVAVGLGKADRGPYDKNGWHSFGEVEDMGSYYSVFFSDDISKIPTLGANGFAFRTETVKNMGGYKNALHIELCVALIRSGFRKFGFVKDAHIVHFIDISPLSFVKRRVFLAAMYSGEKMTRNYHIFSPRQDSFKLVWITLTYPTFIVPFLRAVKGYAVHPNSAWFLHPLMCFSFTTGYGIHYTLKLLQKCFRPMK